MADGILSQAFEKVGVRIQTDNSVGTALVLTLVVVGSYYILKPIFLYLRLLASLFVLPGASLSKFGKRGTWAVVTGASDGIGKEFALQIAAKGFNIALISRTQSKLDTLAQEIESKYKVQTKTFAMDYSKNNDVDFDRMRTMLEGLDISILINNVGQSHSIPVPFVETSIEEIKNIITINCMGTLRTTQIIVPGMIQRKRGLILTMASFAGVMPTPLLATYSGSKAFLQHWSSALGSELASKGIQVSLVQSYLVTSAMSKIRRASIMIPTPKNFVRATLSKIGRSGGAQGIAFTSSPYYAHGIMQWVIATFAGSMSRFTVDKNKVMHEDIRKRALRKAEREAKKQ